VARVALTTFIVGGLSAALAAQAPASAAPTDPARPGSRVTTVESPSWAQLQDNVAAGRAPRDSARPGARALGDGAAAPAAAEPTELASACPAGTIQGTTFDTEGFESGLPFEPEPAGSWTVQTGTAPEGSAYASSTLAVEAQQQDQAAFLQATASSHPTLGALYLSFAYRGESTDDGAERLVYANDWAGSLAPSAQWTRVYLNVTSIANTVDTGVLYTGFENALAGTALDGSVFEVDDVRVYTCVPIPNAGVRGDWTGEGTVDLLATTASDGTLWLYPGKGNGTLGKARRIGGGWGGFTWLASPGDVTGDRRTDLVARNADGALLLYAGRGDAGFSAARAVGKGWNTMTALATPGDMNLDGRAELLARRTDGTLHLYTFTSTGAVQRVKQIGQGWNSTRLVIGRGDLNGDKRGDLIGIRDDGTMWVYTVTASLTYGAARQVGSGWSSMDLVSSPGDLNRDGYNDLVARRTDGTLFFYAGRAGGALAPAAQVGPGWQVFSNVL
jgi:hypothetical protein